MSALDESTREAEQSVLGSMLLSPTALWAALDIVRPTDFGDPRHEVLAQAIADVATANRAVDTVTVGDELIRTGQVAHVTIDYLHTLTSIPTSTANAAFYAEVVHERATLRRVRLAAERLVQGASEGVGVNALLDSARDLLDGDDSERSIVAPVGAAFDDMVVELERPPVYWQTRWEHLNGYIHGLMPGAVYVVAARPGAGKTIMGLQMAVDMTKHGNVAFASLEMSRSLLARRLLASEASLSMTALSRHTLTADDWNEKVRPARDRIKGMPLYIDDRAGVSLTQIDAYARQVARRGKLAGLVVDYLQLIPARDPRKSRWEHVGELTRGFKLLAKDLNVPVVLLSQLNRESERNRRLPTLADLRESGSIEQDADVVIMLQRRVDQDGEPTDSVDVVIPKNRHGQTGRIELLWEGKFARLSSMPWQYADPSIDFKAQQAGDRD